MQLYSAYPLVRARQVTADILGFVAVALSIALGVASTAAIRTLGQLGVGIESAGASFRSTMADAASRLSDVPLIGDGASRPFSSASDAGSALAQAGRDQQSLASTAALVVGLLVAIIPILVVLRVWLWRRIAFARRAARARALAASAGGVELLAVRALSTSTSTDAALLAVSADPVGGWRRGDATIIRDLADLALADAGVPAMR